MGALKAGLDEQIQQIEGRVGGIESKIDAKFEEILKLLRPIARGGAQQEEEQKDDHVPPWHSDEHLVLTD